MLTPRDRILILMPVFNDWDSAALLLRDLDRALASQAVDPDALIVDDGSTVLMPAGFPGHRFGTLRKVEILRLRRNLGHQRAIAVGLVHVHQNIPCRAVVLMDADGEDRADDVPKLLHRFYQDGQKQIIFAARTKRLESAAFRLLYHAYRLLHRLLVGIPVHVGNFSIIPREDVERLAVTAELWNHYAAAVFRTRLPFQAIPLPRGRRLAGESKMDLIALVAHGLSAISVFGDVVGARLLALAGAAIGMASLLIAAVIVVRLATDLAIPGWATYTTGIIVAILLQAVMIAFLLVFMILGSRVHASFLPVRDCPHFVGGVDRVFPADD